MSVWSKLKGALGGSGKQDEGASAASSSRFVWSRNMKLRVAAPQGASWELAEADGGGSLLAAFRCLRTDGALVLHAKLFDVPEGQRRAAEELRAEDWKALWLASTFASIDDCQVELAEHMLGGFRERACEVFIGGQGRDPEGPMRVRERQLPVGGRLLVLTAAGTPELHEVHGRAIEAWIANSTCAT